MEYAETRVEGYEYINPVPRDLPVREVNGQVMVDLTEFDPPFPEAFPNFLTIQRLCVLRFFSNYLNELPDYFCNLEHLKVLFMSCNPFNTYNGLQRLPLRFGYLSQLEELHLVGNHFESFPMPICQLTNMKKLFMDNCALKKIPKEIKKLESLVVIDLSYNCLADEDSLPAEFFALPHVEDLYLIKCQLSRLPHEIGNMRQLVGLRVGSNMLTEFPDELFNLGKLRKLSAERNKLLKLSPLIERLQSLKILLLMENQLTSLPDQIRGLRSCVLINLFDNRLTCLPQSIVEMPLLDSIIVNGNNNLSRPPLDVCTLGMASIKGYFESFANAADKPVHSKRLMIVLLGESEAGKSSLAYALVNARATPNRGSATQSTVGVDFFTWTPMPDGVEFHIVDCAGQRRYQLTHPFFLCPEALHILVVDLFKYEPNESCFHKTVGDWLDLVTSRILKPRIMIVPTHLDKLEENADLVLSKCNDILKRIKHFNQIQLERINYEILEKARLQRSGVLSKGGTDPEWKKENPPIISSVLHFNEMTAVEADNKSFIAMVPVSNEPGLTGIGALQKEIIRVAKDCRLFPSVGRELPPDWIKLGEALKRHKEKNQAPCMPYKEFEEFAAQHTDLSSIGVRSAVGYLDSIGELRYYSSILSLNYNVFIDLRWLAKLVKCLFRHDQDGTLVYDVKFGRFGVSEPYFDMLKSELLGRAVLSEDLLRCLWLDMELTEEMFEEMVELLHHLGLACRLPPEDGTDHPEKFKLLVPWFLTRYPLSLECLPAVLPEDEEQLKLLFMTNYLPPGLFDRLRVRCCSIGYSYYNWKDHVLLEVNEFKVLVHQGKYPPGSEPSSPAIYITGRGPKNGLDELWEVVLITVKETEALLKEWERLSIQRFSVCPPCLQQQKSKPCVFPCNWLSASSGKRRHVGQFQRCNSGILLKGDRFEMSLIRPPSDVVERVLDSTLATVSEDVPDKLIAEIASQLTRKWKVMALFLGFSNDDVERIDADNQQQVEKVISMFTEWKHRKGEAATRSRLMSALVKVDRNDIVEKVRVYKYKE